MCSLIIPSQPAALFFFNRRTHDSTHSMSIKGMADSSQLNFTIHQRLIGKRVVDFLY